jgi:hypothetical protein
MHILRRPVDGAAGCLNGNTAPTPPICHGHQTAVDHQNLSLHSEPESDISENTHSLVEESEDALNPFFAGACIGPNIG